MASELRRVSAPEAAELCESGWVLVDVRTELEWAMGHPRGASNVPWEVRGPSGPRGNDEFLAVMKVLYARDSRILTFCLQGRRSLEAAAALIAAGFDSVIDVRPGWGGLRNPFGGVVEPGWHACGLPSELTTAGSSYPELRARVGLG
jgi:rhodanese-related sulfurtransferase